MAADPGQLERRRVAESRAGPLEALTAASRALAEGASLAATLEALVRAAAAATAADLAVVRVLDADGRRLSARAVVAASPALRAELEGSRVAADEVPDEAVDERHQVPDAVRSAAGRAGATAILVTPVRLHGRTVGVIELARGSGRFDPGERALARIAADHVALAVRSSESDGNGSAGAPQPLDLAADALAAATDEQRTAAEVARLALTATGARACLLWRYGTDAADGLYQAAAAGGDELEPDRARRLALDVLARNRGARLAHDAAGAVLTLPLGLPPIGALQLAFERDAAPTSEVLGQLEHFGSRVARALQAAEQARSVGVELRRTRTLLGVVAQANAHLSLAHTLSTALDRLVELLAVEQVGVYIRQGGRLVAAAGRALGGPHAAVAERLLELALGPFRARGMLLVQDAASDERLAGLEHELATTGIEAAVAAPLLVPDDVIGLLAVYPRRGRTLTANEWTLLAALTAQLAVAIQNARLHEQATQLGEERKRALAEQRRDQEKLEALYEISRAFAQSLSLETTLEAIVRTVVELLDLDAAVIRMPDGRGEQLRPRAFHIPDTRLRAAIQAILLEPQPLEKLPGRRLFRMGKPLVLDADSARRFEVYQLLAPFLEKRSSAIVVPIATPAELLGTLTLLSLDPERPITAEKAEIALSVAAQAALALENARLYQQQKEFADTMQRSLLPRLQPRLQGLEVGDVYESSARVEVGGDVYDFLVLDDGRLAVCLGDVTGHGIDAAADMAMAKFVFRSLAREHPEPADFLAAANEVVCGEIAPGKFITMLYLTIDPASGELACASAGHPAPRLVLPDGTVRPLETRGIVLGIEPGQRYTEVRDVLAPGVTVVVYTDGVIEARRGGELYGSERLDRVLAERRDLGPRQLAQAVVADCRAFSGGELVDDCAVVVIRRAVTGSP